MAAGDRFFYSSQALLTEDLVQCGDVVAYLLTATNPGADCYLQIFDTCGSPTLGDIPAQTFPFLSGSELSWCPSSGGRPFATGLAWATSSTPSTFTASPVTVWVDIEGRDV